ncbi:MAG: glycosyltransferase, partial [Candidatus Hodarchaeota archaeon]
SKVGGIPEIVDDGVTGILVPPGDPEALAEAIISLSMDGNLRRKMGRKGREFIFKKLNSDVIVKQHLQVYRSVCAE